MEKFWKHSPTIRKKPFYKIPLFYIGCFSVVLVIFFSGYSLGKKNEPVDASKRDTDRPIEIKSQMSSSPLTTGSLVKDAASPKANLSATPITQGSGKYYGWSAFEDKEIGVSLYYPPNWFAGRVDGKRILYFHDAENKYYLYFGLRDKGEDDDISLADDLPNGEMAEEGKIEIAGTTVTKYKIVDKNKAKMYLYPKGIISSKNGQKEFMAVFTINDSKLDISEVDLNITDERVIGEKILGSIEIE